MSCEGFDRLTITNAWRLQKVARDMCRWNQ